MAVANRSTLVCVLAALFGISSWIEINGLWVELPLLITRLPESGQLASYIVIITQLANIGPILYGLVIGRFLGKVSDKYLIHGTLFSGTVSCFLLIFFWSSTSYVGSSKYSVAFLVLTFFLAFVDCTSSVLYLPFMSNFKEFYLIPYLIGEGLSGLIPAIVALAQGVGGNPECRNTTTYDNDTRQYNVTVVPYYSPPRFSVEVFFALLTGMLVISWIAFVCLNTLTVALMEQSGQDSPKTTSLRDDNDQGQSQDVLFQPESSGSTSQSEVSRVSQQQDMSQTRYAAFLVLQGVICCFTNGVLPSLQTYSCLPYGNVAYHFSATLANIANPMACMVALFNWTSRVDVLSGLSLMGAVSCAYILSTAILSPSPPLVGTTSGEALVIVSWILFTGVLSYVKACVASTLRKHGGHKSLFYYGVCTQVGSFFGAVITFALVNYASIFIFYTPCQ